jgi:hypothetical protein
VITPGKTIVTFTTPNGPDGDRELLFESGTLFVSSDRLLTIITPSAGTVTGSYSLTTHCSDGTKAARTGTFDVGTSTSVTYYGWMCSGELSILSVEYTLTLDQWSGGYTDSLGPPDKIYARVQVSTPTARGVKDTVYMRDGVSSRHAPTTTSL